MSRLLPAVLLASLLALAGEARLLFAPVAAQAPAGGTVALTGARVIDGTGGAPLERARPSSSAAAESTRSVRRRR
jgi:hypothetical protein